MREPGPWLKWAHCYHQPTVDDYPTFEEAVSSARYASDEGAEAFDCIEGPDGIVPHDVAKAEWKKQEAAAYEERDESPPITHSVQLAPMDGGRPASLGGFHSEADAQAALEELRPRFGDRLSIRKYGKP